MNKKLFGIEFLTQNDAYNNNNENNFKGKLLIYKEIPEDVQKNSYNYFYYNEEETNKILENSVKSKKTRNKYNKLLNLKSNKVKETNDNNNYKQTKSLINFVIKEDKNKNVKVSNSDNNNSNFNSDLFTKLNNININSNNTNKTSKTNKIVSYTKPEKELSKNKETNTKLIKNRNQSSKIFYKFNGNNLAKIRINDINIFSQKVVESPKIQICHFTKSFKNKNDNLYLKPFIIPKIDICIFKNSYIYKENKIILPKNNICYFKKNFIFFKRKSENIIKSKKKFPSIMENIKKIEEKKSPTKKKKENSKDINNKDAINNSNNSKARKSANIVHKNERKSLNKETSKFKKHNSYFIRSQFNNLKSLNQEDILIKLKKENIFHKKLNFLEKEKEIKTKSQKNKKSSILPSLIDNNNNKKEVLNSSSSFDKTRKNSTLFQHLIKKKESNDNIIGLKQSMNKVFLHKNISHDNEFSKNNNDFLISKVKSISTNNTTYKSPKTQINPNIISSKHLIKKINILTNLSRNNNNQLVNLKNQVSYDIHSHNLLDYNHQHQSKNNSINELSKKNLSILKLDNNKLRNNHTLTPYIFKSESKSKNNSYVNIFSGLNKNKKSIVLKKVKYSNNNNDKDLLAIKQYFNIKNII